MEKIRERDSGLIFRGRVISRYLDPVTMKPIPGSEQIDENMVVDTGAVEIVKWLANSTPQSAGAFKYMGIGSSLTAAAHGQTALVAELSGGTPTYARISGTQSVQAEGGNGNKVYQVIAQFPATSATGADTTQELGLFNALTTGIMLIRLVLSPARDNKNNAVEYTYQLTVAPA